MLSYVILADMDENGFLDQDEVEALFQKEVRPFFGHMTLLVPRIMSLLQISFYLMYVIITGYPWHIHYDNISLTSVNGKTNIVN